MASCAAPPRVPAERVSVPVIAAAVEIANPPPPDAGAPPADAPPCASPSPPHVAAAIAPAAFATLLAERLDAHAAARDADLDAFASRHGLARTDALRRAHARARLLFEATRDGGFWRTRWRITNQDASARLVWAA